MLRSISNYRNWGLACTLGFPLLLWQIEQWPGSPLAGAGRALLYSQLVYGLQPLQRHTGPWRNAIDLHMEFVTMLMVPKSSQAKWKQEVQRTNLVQGAHKWSCHLPAAP